MPLIEPTGLLSTPLEALRDLIAATDKWQEWTGTESAAEAKERVHLCDLPEPVDGSDVFTKEELRVKRPFARVDIFEPEMGPGGDAFVARKVAETDYLDTGKIQLDLTDDVPEELTGHFGQAKLKFLNDVGVLLREMLELSAEGGHLVIHQAEIWQAATRVDHVGELTQGDFWRIEFLIYWGI